MQGYGQGFSSFTAQINQAFGGSPIQTTTSFASLPAMSAYDAVMVNLEGGLAPVEVANLQAFVEGGGRALLLGGYNPTWNVSMPQLAAVAGNISFDGSLGVSMVGRLGQNELTDGVSTLFGGIPNGWGYWGPGAGALGMFGYEASGRTYFTILLGGPSSNVLIAGDAGVFGDPVYSSGDNRLFASNVSEWLAASESDLQNTVTPEPGTALLSITGIAALLGLARRRRAA